MTQITLTSTRHIAKCFCALLQTLLGHRCVYPRPLSTRGNKGSPADNTLVNSCGSPCPMHSAATVDATGKRDCLETPCHGPRLKSSSTSLHKDRPLQPTIHYLTIHHPTTHYLTLS